jgi:hypothetical protein
MMEEGKRMSHSLYILSQYIELSLPKTNANVTEGVHNYMGDRCRKLATYTPLRTMADAGCFWVI